MPEPRIKSPPWLELWRDAALERVTSLRCKARREVERLDLELEENPLSSAFSPKLVELMNAEETSGAKERWNERESIAAKVDAALMAETTRHFTAQSEVNQRQWVALFRSQNLNQQQVSEELSEQIQKLSEIAKLPPLPVEKWKAATEKAAETKKQRVTKALSIIRGDPVSLGLGDAGSSESSDKKSKSGDGVAASEKVAAGGNDDNDGRSEEVDPVVRGAAMLTLEDFAAEERRTEIEAQTNLADTERYHIDCAFELQLKRVEAEWGAHEEQMRTDYEAQKVCAISIVIV